MKHAALLPACLAVPAAPALAHVHNVGMDIICSTTDSPPGLTLLPLLLECIACHEALTPASSPTGAKAATPRPRAARR
jgi:hypothetical protein